MKKYYAYDTNNIYTGSGECTPGDVSGSYEYPLNATLSTPPTDEPGKWRREGPTWVEVTILNRIEATQSRYAAQLNELLTALASADALNDSDDADDIRAEYAALLDQMAEEIAAIQGPAPKMARALAAPMGAETTNKRCPFCGKKMAGVTIGESDVLQCPRCKWVEEK